MFNIRINDAICLKNYGGSKGFFFAAVFVKWWKITKKSPCNSIAGLYFEGTCDVISVTMATHKVHKNVH